MPFNQLNQLKGFKDLKKPYKSFKFSKEAIISLSFNCL